MRFVLVERYYKQPRISSAYTRPLIFLQELAKRGHEVHVVFEEPQGFEAKDSSPVKGAVEHPIKIRRFYLGFDNIFFGKKAVPIIEAIKPDAVEVLGPASLYFVLKKKRFATEIHDTAIEIIKNPEYAVKNKFFSLFYYFSDLITFHSSACRIALSRHIMDKAKAHYFLKEIDVVYTPLDLKSFRRSKYKPIVLYVGKLDKRKGAHIFIEASKLIRKKLPKTSFVAVGDGPLRKSFEDAGIKVTGFMPYKKVAQFYSEASVLVYPTTQQGSALAPLEAQAAGIPVIASNVGSMKEELLDNKTGFLVEPRNPVEIAEKTIELLSDKKKLRQMGNNARRFIADNFNCDRQAKKLAEILEKSDLKWEE